MAETLDESVYFSVFLQLLIWNVFFFPILYFDILRQKQIKRVTRDPVEGKKNSAAVALPKLRKIQPFFGYHYQQVAAPTSSQMFAIVPFPFFWQIIISVMSQQDLLPYVPDIVSRKQSKEVDVMSVETFFSRFTQC